MGQQGTHQLGCGCAACSGNKVEIEQEYAVEGGLLGNADYLSRDSFDPLSFVRQDGWHSSYSNIGTGVNLTYSFSSTVPNYVPVSDRAGYRAFDAPLQVRAEAAMDLVSTYTNVNFSEVAQGNNDVISWNILETGAGVAGYAYLPTTVAHGTNGLAGDIFLDDDYFADPNGAEEGTHQNLTILHELGHALGLEHLHSNTSSSPELQAIDSRKYSVMSYTRADNGLEPSSFMIYDIAALQHLYGVNETHNAGFNRYNLGANGEYWNKLKAVWDAGGRDELDARQASESVTLSLIEGTYSSVGNVENFGIAFGAVIENARGGKYDDVILGNGERNRLYGHDGDDSLHGGDNRDYLYGGRGSDEIHGDEGNDYLKGEDGNDVIYGGEGKDKLIGGAGADVLDGGEGRDYAAYHTAREGVTINLLDTTQNTGDAAGDEYISIEIFLGSNHGDHIIGDHADNFVFGHYGDDLIEGNGGSDRLYSGNGNDVVYGGDGNDTIHGGYGDDVLYGESGSDVLRGNAGADTFYISLTDALTGLDRIMDFNQSESDNITLEGLFDFFDGVTDAISDFVSLTTRGGDTYLSFDQDGTDTTHEAVDFARVHNAGGAWTDIDDAIAQGDIVVV